MSSFLLLRVVRFGDGRCGSLFAVDLTIAVAVAGVDRLRRGGRFGCFDNLRGLRIAPVVTAPTG